MSIGILFWILMILRLVLYGFVWFSPNLNPTFSRVPNIFLWVLLALLGWAVFGPIIQGGKG
jgi:hypothetical protein